MLNKAHSARFDLIIEEARSIRNLAAELADHECEASRELRVDLIKAMIDTNTSIHTHLEVMLTDLVEDSKPKWSHGPPMNDKSG
jgi:hypothetical protein